MQSDRNVFTKPDALKMGKGKRMKVSVIIPVYNGAAFVEGCLQSITNQSFRDIEVIVVDDGSTDNTYQLCEAAASIDERVRLIQQKNAGVSAARNAGLSAASGDYVTFVDADDYLVEDAVEVLVKAALQGADFVIASYEKFCGNKAKAVIRQKTEYTRESARMNMDSFDKLIWSPWGKLFKRSIITEHAICFNTSLPLGEDHVFNLSYCSFATKIMILSDVVYRYRLGGVATTGRYYPNFNELTAVQLRSCSAFCAEGAKPEQMKAFMHKTIKSCFLGTMEHYFIHCSFADAVKKMEETFALLTPWLNKDTVSNSGYSFKMARYILQADAKRALLQLYKEQFVRLSLKKVRKLCGVLLLKRVKA